jgi:hypothetical protein
LLRRTKAEAARRGTTVTALIEEGLQLALTSQSEGTDPPVELPISHARGGTLPGVDLNDSAALLDILESGR